MKKLLLVMVFGIVGIVCNAQDVRYVTICTTNSYTNVVSCSVQTNDIVELVGTANGNVQPKGSGSQGSLTFIVGNIFTGLTNVSVSSNNGSLECATFKISSPSTPVNVVSNYVPADAIVIPASVTGNVQIILESSPDLVNWTAAMPGIYGPSAATNRFFRVRAQVN